MPLVTVVANFWLNVSEIITGPTIQRPQKDPDHKDSFNENEQEIAPPNHNNGKTYTKRKIY